MIIKVIFNLEAKNDHKVSDRYCALNNATECDIVQVDRIHFFTDPVKNKV